MTVQISDVAFEAELSGMPDTVYALKGCSGDGGVKFVDFGYDAPGECIHRLIGMQIGATRSAQGASLSFGRDQRDETLGRDVFVLRGPGHEGLGTWDGPYRGRYLIIAPNAVERMLRTPLSRIAVTPLVGDLAERRDVHHLLAALSQGGTEPSSDDLLLLESVAISVMRAAGVRSQERVRKAPMLSQAQAKLLYNLIASRLAQPLSLGEMAAAVGLSDSYLVRAFTGSFGVSPYRYVLRERVALAQSLIERGGRTLTEIAALSGFSDANGMSRTFRNMTGRSPTGSVKSRRTAKT